MSSNRWWIVAVLLGTGVFAYQATQIGKLKREVASLRAELPLSAPRESSVPVRTSLDSNVEQRLARVEESLTVLKQTGRMPRGPVAEAAAPQTEDELAQMQQRLFDPATGEGERLKALNILRRNHRMTDEMAIQAMGMLQNSTNAAFRRELLSQVQGSTNGALKQPLLDLLNSENTDNGLREQLVSSLRNFAADPAVDAKLWDLALNDPNTRVREQAREAIARAPATPERLEQMLAKASSADASLDERLVSFRALRLAKSYTPELVSDLANLAQNTTDPIARAKLFKSFNGLTDESLMLPLVNGLQDADPVVRQNAANALSEFPDPRVEQWLSHLLQNDSDPAVKRQAHAALERIQRLARKAP